MPDAPVAPPGGAPYDPVMEARVSRLVEDMHDVKASNARLEATTTRLEATTARLDATTARLEAAIIEIKAILTATLPHLATKADLATEIARVEGKVADLAVKLADKPGKTYMWGILAVLLTAYGCGLAGLAILK